MASSKATDLVLSLVLLLVLRLVVVCMKAELWGTERACRRVVVSAWSECSKAESWVAKAHRLVLQLSHKY